MVRVLSISTGTRWTTFRHCPFNAFKHCHISQMSSSRISFLKIIIAKKLCNNLFLNIILKMSLVIRMVEQQQCLLLLLLWGGGGVLTHPLVCVAHADAWRWVSMGLTPGTPLHPYIRGVAAGGRNGPPPHSTPRTQQRIAAAAAAVEGRPPHHLQQWIPTVRSQSGKVNPLLLQMLT